MGGGADFLEACPNVNMFDLIKYDHSTSSSIGVSNHLESMAVIWNSLRARNEAV